MKVLVRKVINKCPIRPWWDGPKSFASSSGIEKNSQAHFIKTHNSCITASGNHSPSHGLWQIKNGRVLGNTAATLIDTCMIEDLSYEFFGSQRKHSIFQQVKTGKRQLINGKVLKLSDQFSATNNIMHWVVDWLPKLAILEAAGLSFSDFDAIILHHSQNLYNRFLLDRLKIPLNKVIWSDFQSNFQAETLYVPTPIQPQGDAPRWALEYARYVFSDLESEKRNRKLYISREDASGRRIKPVSKFESLCAEHGFEKILLSSVEPSEQIKLFKSASEIIAPHGAGLTNLVFCEPGTRVLELFSSAYAYICYGNIARSLDLNYRELRIVSTLETKTPFVPFSTNNGHPEVGKLTTDDIVIEETSDWKTITEFLGNAE